MAMFGILAITAIAGMLTLAGLQGAASALRRTDRSEHLEQAVHLADAGVARALAAIGANPAYSTTVAVPPVPTTRAWVIAQAATAPLETAREGQYAWVVPAGADVVFGVGYIPSRAAPRETRVLRVDASVVRPIGLFSLLTTGSLLVEGNPTIDGGVHTNGNLTLTGDPEIGGDATASGTFTAPENPQVGGQTGGGFAPVSVPAVDPRSYRNVADVDLCPDGTARTIAANPCTGTVVGNGSPGYQGWTRQSGEWRTTNNVGDGVFYIYRSNVKVSGNVGSWNATLLIEGERVNGSLINGDLEVTGNIELTGDVQVDGSTQMIAFVVDRDIVINGNGFFEGLIHAGEQVDIAGNSEIAGQVIASGTTSSAGSPVSANRMHGNPRMTQHNNGPATSSSIDAGGWEEL